MDVVNQPPHYVVGGIEAIDFIRAKLSESEFRGYLRGNLLKYVARAGHKGKEVEDLRKAEWYLRRLLDVLEGEFPELSTHSVFQADFGPEVPEGAKSWWRSK